MDIQTPAVVRCGCNRGKRHGSGAVVSTDPGLPRLRRPTANEASPARPRKKLMGPVRESSGRWRVLGASPGTLSGRAGGVGKAGQMGQIGGALCGYGRIPDCVPTMSFSIPLLEMARTFTLPARNVTPRGNTDTRQKHFRCQQHV